MSWGRAFPPPSSRSGIRTASQSSRGHASGVRLASGRSCARRPRECCSDRPGDFPAALRSAARAAD